MVLKKRGIIVVVLALFCLIFFSQQAISPDVSGCYVYPQASEDLYCVAGVLQSEAAADCAENPACEMNEHFIPGSDCSALAECKEVTCTADCQTHALGKCIQLGGQEIPEGEYPLWCSPGCCKIADKFCQFNLNKWQCLDKANKLGYNNYDIFDNSLAMDAAKCNQMYCGLEVQKGSISGYVVSSKGELLASVQVSLEGTGLKKTTDSSGKYDFSNINPGTYLVKAVLEGYIPASFSVSLLPGQLMENNITLSKAEGVADVYGIVRDKENNLLPGSTISWTGPNSGQVFSNETGEFLITGLPAGSYSLTASKVGFQAAKKDISITTEKVILNFLLEEEAFQGIEGKTYLDKNNNNQLDPEDEAIYGVKIYVDGIFKSYSQYPNGNYQVAVTIISADAAEEHKLSATYQDYNFGPESLFLTSGQSFYKEILLTKYIGECTFPNPVKDVEEFYALHIRGQQEVKLSWKKPCPEVINYLITKYQNGVKVDDFTASPAENFRLDAEVEWGQAYTYEIVAVYDQGRVSEHPTEVTITLGDKDCEGRYNEASGWDKFCIIQSESEANARKKIFTCDDQNKIIVSKDCTESDGPGEVYFCAEINLYDAVCKNAGICSSAAQQADPFGLYYSRSSCYGSSSVETEGAANYCYFDFTDSIIDGCQSCENVFSCFDYQSKDACAINNCLGAECQWIDSAAKNPLLDYSLLFPGLTIPEFVTLETGAGYCTEADYSNIDKCSWCGPEANLYENNFCTAEVCTSLGKCFSNSVTKDKPLRYCESCTDKPTLDVNCYTYSFESECNGGQNLEKNDRQELTLSKDKCSWGRCFWNGLTEGPGSCVKDGNGDGNDDCSAFSNAGERNACRRDVYAPVTKLVGEGVSVISQGQPNVTFQSKDEEGTLAVVGYCLASADPNSPGICTDFSEQAYPGKLKDETVKVDLLHSKYLQQEIPGQTYMLKYYSRDKYFNQENVQTSFVFVDNVAPQFEINQKIETVGDATKLTVYLEGTNEPMECSFALAQVVPAGQTLIEVAERSQEKKEVVFENLPGVQYDLNVTCEDNFGNKNIKEKKYTFDLENKITIIYPEINGVVASTSIIFRIETAAGASCSLYETATNNKVADFVSNEEGKVHETPNIPGFSEREYAAEYKAVCKELFTEDTYEDYFHFWVDFTPPGTGIILQEGARIVKPVGFDWEEYFVSSVLVTFECQAEGFECEETRYCLGEGCDLINNPGYNQYTGVFAVANSTRICYYSTDTANNPSYQPLCGNIKVEGYGITLEKPELYYYAHEMWGISNQKTFSWQFFTRVPTQICGYDFQAGFDYTTLPPHKVMEINAQGKYLMEKFPEEAFSSYSDSGGIKAVYVKCENLEGEIGPEQKMYLEYDPSAPVITSAYAQPDNVLEGIITELFVTTDDKTSCKYSDNSDGSGSIEYETMEYSFPGIDEKILETNHQAEFNINFIGAKKNYVLNVMCRNGAGDYSELEQINFAVDYSAAGNIVNVSPSGYTRVPEVVLVVDTNKKAYCEFKQNELYGPFPEGLNSKQHKAPLGTLSEGKYAFPIKCTMGEHLAEALAEFTVDLTAPVISSVDDSSYSCGKDYVYVMVYSNEESIAGYYYEVYDLGAAAGSADENETDYYSQYLEGALGTSEALVLNATVPAELPIEVPVSGLIADHKYLVKVMAGDAAGNWGALGQGDGFITTSKDYSYCQNDSGAPETVLTVDDKSSCSTVSAELHCLDGTGCQINYGQASSAALCQPLLAYNGQKVLFEQNGWICYKISDNMGNNYTGVEKIDFEDHDGDGVLDQCDECKDTGSGKIADEMGCASGEVPESEKGIDTDKDGLPDYWEKINNGFDCEFNFETMDSNGNGINDALEDYDNDGYSSFEEYQSGTNPCKADQPAEIKPGLEVVPTTIILEEQPKVVAWVFLILGLFAVLGGMGYLVYYYKYSAAGKAGPRISAIRPEYRPTARKTGIISSWKEKLESLRKAERERIKMKERSTVFSEFTPESRKIPHVEELLNKKAPQLSHLDQLAQKYTEHKEEIKPGLRPEEKSIFNRLESIAKQTKEKEIGQVVGEKEAKDLFEKLRKISSKRKS